MRYILASKSPRRKELLSQIIDNFEIITADVDENLGFEAHPRTEVKYLAAKKGDAVAKDHRDAIVISSDTLVEVDGEALGKPKDKDDAFRMLKSLSGRAHNVHTGVAVHYCGLSYCDVATTTVYFREMTDEEILDYIESGDPMDKAGSYGIQSGGGKFVEKIEGDYDTVVGLSLTLTKQLIDEALND